MTMPYVIIWSRRPTIERSWSPRPIHPAKTVIHSPRITYMSMITNLRNRSPGPILFGESLIHSARMTEGYRINRGRKWKEVETGGKSCKPGRQEVETGGTRSTYFHVLPPPSTCFHLLFFLKGCPVPHMRGRSRFVPALPPHAKAWTPCSVQRIPTYSSLFQRIFF